MKEINFPTQRRTGPDGRDSIELPINGEIYFAYRPTTNSIALFYASNGRKSAASAINGIMEFLEKSLEPEAYSLIMGAVENDVLDFEALVSLAQEIITEFAQNPTGSSAGSASSRTSTGPSSTATSRPVASTRVRSTPRASAT